MCRNKLGLLLLLMCGTAQALDVQQWTTQRGSRVFFVPAAEIPMVDLRVVFDAGSARDGKHGVARMVNRLLDDGTDEMDAGEIARRLENVGARLSRGSRRDMAWVALRSLSEPEVLGQAADVVAQVLGEPSFPEQAIERERRRMFVSMARDAESPAKIARQAFFKEVFRDHPYGTPEGGTAYGVRSIRRLDLGIFHQRYYTTGNAVVAIVGDLDREAAERLADRVTGQLPEGPRAEPLPDVEPLSGARSVRIEFPSAQTHVFIGEPVLSRDDPDFFPLYVGNQILGGNGLVSRLGKVIRQQRGMSYSVYCFFLPMERQGPFLMGLQTQNSSVDEAVYLMRQVLTEFVNQGPTDQELAQAKRYITGSFPLRIGNNRRIARFLALIGYYDLPWDYLETYVDEIDAVTTLDVVDAFQRRLNPERMVTILVGGKVPGQAPPSLSGAPAPKATPMAAVQR